MTSFAGPYRPTSIHDVLNSLPAMFGYRPRESVVLLDAEARPGCGFAMRLDLPTTAPDRLDLGMQVTRHLVTNRVDRVMVVCLSEDPAVAEELVWALDGLFGARLDLGIWATDRQWWLAGPEPVQTGEWFPDDHHPAIVAAIAHGRVVVRDRDDLYRDFDAETGPRRAALDQAATGVLVDCSTLHATRGDAVAAEDVTALLLAAIDHEVDDVALLRLAAWTRFGAGRDAVWDLLTSANARRLLEVWTNVARAAPTPLRGGALAVAALCAWRVGDGTRCQIAAELALAAHPGHPLALVIVDLLGAGLGPEHHERFMQARRTGAQEPTEP